MKGTLLLGTILIGTFCSYGAPHRDRAHRDILLIGDKS
jgi:hypothetical protein